ncbi:helix-turn-helix domain-containing protein [Paenibacillus sp. GCM10023252]|uniref:helix-turn-helix domain-containing protein n=1 Tax=Paenibacillus sp. GCM10023252 TaxID=3252649 RepID=UPI00361DAC2C
MVDKNALSLMAIHIHLLHDEHREAGWQGIRRSTNLHTLYWVHEGRGIFTQGNGMAVEAEQGSLFYLHPGVQLSMEADEHEPLHIIMILMDIGEAGYGEGGWTITSLTEPLPIPFHLKCTGQLFQLMNARFDLLLKGWSPGNPPSELRTKVKLLEFLAEGADSGGAIREGRAQNTSTEALEQYKRVLDEQYAVPLNQQELCESLGLSASYARRRFQERWGCSPKAYINYLRNERAKRLLLYTDMPLRSIAQAIGYSDEYQFSAAFKRMNGEAPSKYRSRHTAPADERVQ